MNAKYPIYLQLLKASAKKHQQTEQPAVAWQPTDTTKKAKINSPRTLRTTTTNPTKSGLRRRAKRRRRGTTITTTPSAPNCLQLRRNKDTLPLPKSTFLPILASPYKYRSPPPQRSVASRRQRQDESRTTRRTDRRPPGRRRRPEKGKSIFRCDSKHLDDVESSVHPDGAREQLERPPPEA